MMNNPAAPGTVGYEALQFLRDNAQHHSITTSALASGIGRPVKRLIEQLHDAVDAAIIERQVGVGGAWIWSVGPNADFAQSSGPGEDVQKVVKVSAMAAPSIFAYADQRGAAAFSTALSDDGRLSIERYGRIICELTDTERRALVKTASKGVLA